MEKVVKSVKYKGDVVDEIEIDLAENLKECVKIAGSEEKVVEYFNYAHTDKLMNAARSKAELKASGGVPKSVAKMLGDDPEKIAKFRELIGLD